MESIDHYKYPGEDVLINEFDCHDAKTANVLARVEPDVKEEAESILNELGVPAVNAIIKVDQFHPFR